MLANLWDAICRFFRGWFGKSITTYSAKESTAAQLAILNMPATIRLKPTSEIAWSDNARVETYQKLFQAENLTLVGRYKIAEMERCYIEAHADQDREFYALILQFQHLLYLDLTSSCDDKTNFTVCDATQNMSDRPPWQTTLFLTGKSPKQMLKAFLEKRPQKPFQLVGPDFFVDQFCQAYARETRWRKSQLKASTKSSEE
jgi:hypothetical protein